MDDIWKTVYYWCDTFDSARNLLYADPTIYNSMSDTEIGKGYIRRWRLQHGKSDGTYDLNSCLLWCAKIGQCGAVKTLLNKGADLHALNDKALLWACVWGHLESVMLLVNRGADMHAENDIALRCAANEGHVDVVEYLISKGANTNAGWICYDSALVKATRRGNLNIVKMLYSDVSKIKASGKDISLYLSHCLYVAGRKGYWEIAKFYLENGVEVSSNLLWYAVKERFVTFVQVLLEYGADATDEGDNQLLYYAAKNGLTEIVEILLEYGADVHGDDDYALQVAVAEQKIATVKLLLENRADLHLDNNYVLMKAINLGNKELVDLLITYGADVSKLQSYVAEKKRLS